MRDAAVTTRSTPTARLKPERIQERLAGLPGWGLTAGGTALARGFDFPTQAVALAFLSYASEAARTHGRRLRLTLSGPRLEITLPAEGELTEADLDFGAALLGLPAGGNDSGRP